VKRCSRCKQFLPLDRFYKRSASPDGRFAYCKPCHSEYDKARRATGLCVRGDNQPRLKCSGCKEYHRARRAARVAAGVCPRHPASDRGDCASCTESRRKWYHAQRASGKCPSHAGQPARGCAPCLAKLRDYKLSKWGFTRERYDEVLRAQGGGCKVCGGPSGARRFSVDHDHATGRVRGLLCHYCNLALGLAKDSPERLVALAEYLEPTPEWIGAGC